MEKEIWTAIGGRLTQKMKCKGEINFPGPVLHRTLHSDIR